MIHILNDLYAFAFIFGFISIYFIILDSIHHLKVKPMPTVNNLYDYPFIEECSKHKGHGLLNCTPCAIERAEKKRKELETLIKLTTMGNKEFSFDKAIQGSPIYCDELRCYPIYSPHTKQFAIDGYLAFQGVWDENGKIIQGSFYKEGLTTTPPLKKVKKTVTVTLYKNNLGEIMATTINTQAWNQSSIIDRREIEIEVEE